MSIIHIQGATGAPIPISELAVQQSSTLSNLVNNLGAEAGTIPITNIDGSILKLIADWCEQHKGEEIPTDEESNPKIIEIPEWDQEFLNGVSNQVLYDLIVAVNYLDIKRLMNYACKKVSNMTIGKKTEELRLMFGINTDEEDLAEEEAKK